jgi:hypothetical protein
MLSIKILSGSMIAVLLAIGSHLSFISTLDSALARVGTNTLGEVANAAQKAPSASVAITDRTIGAAKVGMTFGQLKKALGSTAQFKVESPFMVDFDAVAVSQSGKLQYRIIYAAHKQLKDGDVIELLRTENANYKTVQGVGPGMTLKQAEAIYGKATLSYHVDNEMREIVVFAKQPTYTIMFVPKAKGKQVAGVYGAGEKGFFQTDKYQPNAVIESVMVSK